MAGKTEVVSPLENLGVDRVRNKEMVSRTITWIWLCPLSLLDKRFDLLSYCGHHTGHWQDGVRFGRCFLRGVHRGEGVRLDIPRARVSDGKGESSRKQRPVGLTGVELLGRLDVCQVFMVSPQNERQFRSLQPMHPLLQSKFNNQQLPITHIVVPFSRCQATREESAGMKLLVCASTLTEHRSHSWTGGIHFHDELPCGISVNHCCLIMLGLGHYTTALIFLGSGLNCPFSMM